MEYTIAEKDSFKVMGIRRTTPYGGGTWDLEETVVRFYDGFRIAEGVHPYNFLKLRLNNF